MKIIKVLTFLLLLSACGFSQTHTFCPLDGACVWTAQPVFQKGILQNYHSLYCQTAHDGVTDDGPTINNCIQQALGTGTGGYIWSTVVLPAGLTHIVTPINMTHTIGMILQGAGGDQISAVNNTYLMCDTGATSAVCLDRTGSKNTIMRGFTMRSASTYAHPSQVLIIAGRDNVVTFSEFNELDHLYLFADHSVAGSVAYYNVTAETEKLHQVKALADHPFNFSASNVFSITSPYQPTFPGSIASMTNITCDLCSATVFGSGNAAYNIWSGQDFLFLNSHAVLGGGYTPLAAFSFSNSGVANIKIIGGQYEDLPRFLIANSAIDHLTVDSMVVAPTAPLIHFEATTGLTASKINLAQVGGGTQYLFDTVGANTISGSDISMASTAGVNDTNITISSSTLYRDGGAGLTVNAASDYIDLGSTGTVIKAKSASFSTSATIGASGSAISDSRELIQSSHFCGTTSTCANTANGSNREIFGSVALASASPSTVTVSGISPAFTSTSTYFCTFTPEGATAAIAAGGVAYTKVSGSSFTITGPNTVTTVIDYRCTGN